MVIPNPPAPRVVLKGKIVKKQPRYRVISGWDINFNPWRRRTFLFFKPVVDPDTWHRPPKISTSKRMMASASHNKALEASPTTPPPTSRPPIIDDKSSHCIPFILSLLSQHQTTSSTSNKPFIIGLNGIQGSGKTTLVTILSSILSTQDPPLSVLVLSIDDLYLTHSDQKALSAKHPNNPLVRCRGEPGTHDMDLAREVFTALMEGRECKVPEYDKSAFDGEGDRVPTSQWKTVNRPGQTPIQIIIFEGWCVGFSALTSDQITTKRSSPSITLQKNTLENLLFINSQLKSYEFINQTFNAFIHLDAEDTSYVYEWRKEQERELREKKGMGMTDDQVERFVDGYYPAYELYTEGLREGVLKGEGKRQLRLVLGRDRKVKEILMV